MPGIYIRDESRELLRRYARENGIEQGDLLDALLKQHGATTAARIGRAQKALRGAVDGKVRS